LALLLSTSGRGLGADWSQGVSPWVFNDKAFMKNIVKGGREERWWSGPRTIEAPPLDEGATAEWRTMFCRRACCPSRPRTVTSSHRFLVDGLRVCTHEFDKLDKQSFQLVKASHFLYSSSFSASYAPTNEPSAKSIANSHELFRTNGLVTLRTPMLEFEAIKFNVFYSRVHME
jgi:hypothetical protein